MIRWAMTAGGFSLLLAACVSAEDAGKGVTVDAKRNVVLVDAKVAVRKLAHLEKVYPIELIASWPHPQGKKAHETVVVFEAKPSDVAKGLEQLGLKAGKPAKGENSAAEGPEVNVFLEVPAGDGTFKKLAMERVLQDPKSKKPLPKGIKFRFTGSVMSAADPNKPDAKVYGADLTGTLIALFPVTDECVLQTSLTMKEEKYLKLDVNAEALPKEGTPIKLVIEVPRK